MYAKLYITKHLSIFSHIKGKIYGYMKTVNIYRHKKPLCFFDKIVLFYCNGGGRFVKVGRHVHSNTMTKLNRFFFPQRQKFNSKHFFFCKSSVGSFRSQLHFLHCAHKQYLVVFPPQYKISFLSILPKARNAKKKQKEKRNRTYKIERKKTE